MSSSGGSISSFIGSKWATIAAVATVAAGVAVVPIVSGSGTCTSSTPSVCGFPDLTNTGVPSGTTLTSYSGPSNVTTANTTIDSKNIGCIQISAANVTIKNSVVTCSGISAVTYDDDGSSGSPLIIQDSKIDCGVTDTTGVGEADYTLLRVEITGCVNGCEINRDILIQDSYIHNLASVGADPHEDGCQFGAGHFEGASLITGVKNVTFSHNTIYGINSDGTFGTSAIISGIGSDTNVVITNNLLAGGAYTLYCEQLGHAYSGTSSVTNNHFSTRFGSNGGAFGKSTECADETASGNVTHETGAPYTLEN